MSKPLFALASLTSAVVLSLAAPHTDAAATFAGVPVVPNGITRASVPLSAQERQYVSEGGNVVPDHAVAALAVPNGFDPARSWMVVIALSTSDFQRKNSDDLRDFYSQAALAENCVVLAGDGAGNPPHDTAGWRAGMTLAALDALHRSFPGSTRWPLVVAGFSGGAKRAGNLAPLLAVAGNQIAGIFLTGINEDRLSEGYRKFQPGASFLRTPVYISSGQLDPIAGPAATANVQRSIQQTGFSNVRLAHMPHAHAVSRSAVREALHWFREQAH